MAKMLDDYESNGVRHAANLLIVWGHLIEPLVLRLGTAMLPVIFPVADDKKKTAL